MELSTSELPTKEDIKPETRLPEHRKSSLSGCLVWPQWKRICLMWQRLMWQGWGIPMRDITVSEEKGGRIRERECVRKGAGGRPAFGMK